MGGPYGYGGGGYEEWRRAQEEQRLAREAAAAADKAAEELLEMDEEKQAVVAWRLLQFRTAGVDYDHAVLLANETTIDWHDAVELIGRAGAETAFRILA